MKTLNPLLLTFCMVSLLFIACEDDDDGVVTPAVNPTYSVVFNMEHLANGMDLQLNTSDFPYSNGLNQQFKVTKLQYLISKINFNKSDGSKFTIDEYHYVDFSNPSTLKFSSNTKVPKGTYTSVNFTFGFDESDNISGAYQDLNTLSWNWPSNPNSMFGNLGGGYHFMRLEGNYIAGTDTAAFKTHMGTARDTTTNPHSFIANHFIVNASPLSLNITTHIELDIVMNINEWYVNPTTWDFKVWNMPIMPTFDAQRALNANGPDVFTVKPS